jgi:acetylornithine deacetylase/succinyl-diaminopimelate desuccinylase-like protein
MTDIADRTLDLAVQIQQIAAPTFAEGPRAEFVRARFIAEGLKDVSMDSHGNVYARLPGKNKKTLPLIVSAHLDTVFPLQTNLQVAREAGKIAAPGIGDNSLGVASLFGILWSLRERKLDLKGDLWFVANVCEEGLGDLRGMKEVVEHFGAGVTAYLVIEGLALGHVYHRAVGVRRYRVTARTMGGHSWSDYGQPSAVHESAALVTRLTSLPLPRQPRTTLNVGVMTGGTSVNTLAAEASFDLDLRSEDASVLTGLIKQTEELILAANRKGVRFEAEVIGQRPAGEIPADHPLVVLAEECLREQGLEAALTSGSTDANVPLSRGIPALVLGVTKGGGAHTMQEYILTEPVRQGLEQLVSFVSRVFERR